MKLWSVSKMLAEVVMRNALAIFSARLGIGAGVFGLVCMAVHVFMAIAFGTGLSSSMEPPSASPPYGLQSLSQGE
jgi:hypothetical protein